MKEDELPQQQLAAVTDNLEATLAKSGGSFTRAAFFVRFEDPNDPNSPLTDGKLMGLAPTKGPVPGYAGSGLSQMLWGLLRASQQAGKPVRALQYAFTKGEQGWQRQILMESLEEYAALCRALEPLEKRVVELALELAGSSWTRLALSRRPPKPDKLVVASGDKRAIRDLPEPLRGLFDELQAFFRQRGRDLEVIEFALEGEPDDYQSNRSYHYRLLA